MSTDEMEVLQEYSHDAALDQFTKSSPREAARDDKPATIEVVQLSGIVVKYISEPN